MTSFSMQNEKISKNIGKWKSLENSNILFKWKWAISQEE